MLNILITDPISNFGINSLKKKGYNVFYKPDINKEDLINEIKDKDAIILRGRTKITKDILDNANKLKLIVRAGVGLDNIDINYAKFKGIEVRNTPLAPVYSVAELTICLILNLLRGVIKGNLKLKEGKWIKKELIGYQLFGKTIGIVGFGRIGYEVGKRLKSFGCKIIAYDVDPSREKFSKEINAEFTLDFDYVLKNSDIITIHVPLIPSTYKMFSKETMKKMKKGSYLINTSRGEVIDEASLLELLEEKHIAGAALDVFESEPPVSEIERKLINKENVVCTPHIGAQTYEAMELEAKEVIEIIEEFFKMKNIKEN